jgi:hypothetical protein
MRVPLIVVSPWSKGGWVISQGSGRVEDGEDSMSDPAMGGLVGTD